MKRMQKGSHVLSSLLFLVLALLLAGCSVSSSNQGAAFFDLFDPIRIDENQTLTIEGYLNRRVEPYPPCVMFVGVNDKGEVVKRYVNLMGSPQVENPGQNAIVRVRGKIIKANDGIGDMEVTEVAWIAKDMDGILEAPDVHWSILSRILLAATNSTIVDGGSSDPLFNQKTQEVVLSHNVGEMKRTTFGDFTYVPKVQAYYFVSLNGEITRILLVYVQDENA